MDALNLIKGAIDIHIHIGPDPNRRRRLTAYEAAVQAKEAGMRGIVLKSHDYITTPVTYLVQQLIPGIEVFGGLSLDEEIGGLNPATVEMAGKIRTRIIWMPTFSSRCDMEKKKIDDKGIRIVDGGGKILPAVTEILKLIIQYDMTLATGHISTQEIFALLEEGQRVGVKRTIITHPLSFSFGCRASIEDQKRMIREGVFIEHCFIATMPTSDRIDPQRIVEAIRAVGPEHCILSTDFGQIFNPPPVEGLRMYIETLMRYGISEDEIITMVQKNPAKALGLPVY
jgi:imidazolonepropionase-like amidohydrolase